MALNTSLLDVPGWLALAPSCGLPAVNFAPLAFQSQAQTSAQKNLPPGAPSDWLTVATASLLARGIIYFKTIPGDCGLPTTVNFDDAELAGTAGSVAVGIASMAGAVLPGIGPAIKAIQAIFAAHAQAVANEQKTICSVAGVINQVFAYYDAKVKSGALSPATAIAGMQSFLATANGQLQTIYKKCNASCVYMGILAAHSDFVKSYYAAIAPAQMYSSGPSAAPTYLPVAVTPPPAPLVYPSAPIVPGSSGTPGGFRPSGSGYNIGFLPAAAPVLGISAATLGWILAALLAIFVVIGSVL